MEFPSPNAALSCLSLHRVDSAGSPTLCPPWGSSTAGLCAPTLWGPHNEPHGALMVFSSLEGFVRGIMEKTSASKPPSCSLYVTENGKSAGSHLE